MNKLRNKITSLGLSGVLLVQLVMPAGVLASEYQLPTAPTPPPVPDLLAAPTPAERMTIEEIKQSLTPTPTPTSSPSNEGGRKNKNRNTEENANQNTSTSGSAIVGPVADTPVNPVDASVQGQMEESSESLPTGTSDANTQPTVGTSLTEASGGQSNNSNNEGKAAIETGDVEGVITVGNEANTNVSGSGSQVGGDYLVANEKNGAGSSNAGSIEDVNNTVVGQENAAYINNKLNADLETGGNKITDNIGDGSEIVTGDATSTVNVFNFANTNVAGVQVSSNEFNVVDAQSGDIDLTNLTQGCNVMNTCGTDSNVEVNNSENGGNSDNEGVVVLGNNVIITSDNYAEVNNDINIEVDTGGNKIADSLGDALIETGDASVIANIFNFLNTNLAGVGEIIVNTVNILGEFAGNILLPATGSSSSDPNYIVNNTGNGANSDNNASIEASDQTTLTQSNDAVILNTINADANTGDNDLKDNINGEGDSSSIQTGAINSQANLATVANQNIVGGDMNIIIVNGQNSSAVYVLGENGELIPLTTVASNTGNGAGSDNTVQIVDENNTTVTQNNQALVNNNINIDANTGNNVVRDNIDGSAAIKTGDVNIFASVTNFINNNFIGGNIVLTIVNDFMGLWSGGFAFLGGEPEVEELASPVAEPEVVVNELASSVGTALGVVGGPMVDVVMTPIEPVVVNEVPSESAVETVTESELANTPAPIVNKTQTFPANVDVVLEQDATLLENDLVESAMNILQPKKALAGSQVDMSDVDFVNNVSEAFPISPLQMGLVSLLLLSGVGFILRSSTRFVIAQK